MTLKAVESGMLLSPGSNFAGGKRAWYSDVAVQIPWATARSLSSGETRRTMFKICVLVSSMIRCDSTTCALSPGSQTGVAVPVPVSPTSPWQPRARAAHSGSTRACHRVGTENRLACRIEEPPTEGRKESSRRRDGRPGWLVCGVTPRAARSSVIFDALRRRPGRKVGTPPTLGSPCRAGPSGLNAGDGSLSPAATREHEQADRDEQRCHTTARPGRDAAAAPVAPTRAGRAAGGATARVGRVARAGERAVDAHARRADVLALAVVGGRAPAVRAFCRRAGRLAHVIRSVAPVAHLASARGRRDAVDRRSCSSWGWPERPPFQPRTGRRAR